MLWLVTIGGCVSAEGAWDTQVYQGHIYVARGETTEARESSGVVASRVNPRVYWTHNDSGAPHPRVYAFRLNDTDRAAQSARHLGYVEITGASNIDWEDIAIGPQNRIYILDGGDNPPCERADKRIHRFEEPAIDADGPPVALTRGYESIRFEYPRSGLPDQPADTNDDRYDCECLMVHPVTGDIYLVTKRNNADITMARVYRLPAASLVWNSPTVHVLEFVADLTGRVPNMTTAGDIHVTGRRMVLRNYWSAYEFVIGPDEPFESIFARPPREYSLLLELAQTLQGEGICYGVFDGDMITTTESRGDARFRIFALRWALADARADQITPTSAVVRWQTREALDGRVEYGPTTEYGRTATTDGPGTSHRVTLAGLTPETRYYFRVLSGPLSYPPAADADTLFFHSAAALRPDFDRDGDVDLADFALLQRCLSGTGVSPTEPACQNVRLDGDSDVDIHDLLLLRSCLSGADIPASPTCYP